ncbi:MAG: anion permease [Halobacteriaceae archaeon]
MASLFMAWSIGAGSSGSTPFAPAVGANAIPVMRAGFFVGILGFLGAVFQGANVSEAMGQELIIGTNLTPIAATIALLTAAILVAIGIFMGYPIATAFTSTGAVVGAGLALGGQPAIPKYKEIVTLWILVPFVGSSIAYLTAKFLREVNRDIITIPALGFIVGSIIANIKFVVLGPPDQAQSFAYTYRTMLPVNQFLSQFLLTGIVGILIAGVLFIDVRRDAEGGQRHFLLSLGGLVAFSAGGSQVGLAVGPLIPLIGDEIALIYILIGGGLGLLIGSWTGAPRMIKALSQDYSSLGPRRSIAAMIPSFAIAQIAVFYGIPISFNEIIVSAIIGSGYVAGGSNISKRKMIYTVFAWIGSLLTAFIASYVGFVVLNRVLLTP